MQLHRATPVTQLKTVGPASAKRLHTLGIRTLEDLIFYYPYRYDDLSAVVPIASASEYTPLTVLGRITAITSRRSWKRRTVVIEAMIEDETGSLKVVWFNQVYILKSLQVGDAVYLSGKITHQHDVPVMSNPVYEKVKQFGPQLHTGRIVPIYSTTSGLTQKQLRWFMSQALPIIQHIDDWLPLPVRRSAHVCDIHDALRQIHFPQDAGNLERAQQRLKFDELFLFVLQSQLVRRELRLGLADAIPFTEAPIRDFVTGLPFTLTPEQKKVAWDIIQDIGKPQPMNRLLEGEVGSGKTAVAALVMYSIALQQRQSVLMAPTEILAQQHFTTLQALYRHASIPVENGSRTVRLALITSSHQQLDDVKMSRQRLVKIIAQGGADVIIGTHALLQELVSFHKVALTIIDEQHRFGVDQRKILHDKARHRTSTPHFLSMTATPIPRSLALTLYGDLEVSMIRQLPAGRKKIETRIVSPAHHKRAYGFIAQQLEAGRQAYVICPLIDPADTQGVASVADTAEELATLFPKARIAVVHGKLKSAVKREVMDSFTRGAYDILVATTVIEVGINVPNATVIVIHGAERFGLAQLYQLRGRVGRGEHQSYCLLFPQSLGEKTRQRLDAFIKAKDSFELAELDLSLRGPGDILGSTQSGWPTFKLASVLDYATVQAARKATQEILDADPQLQGYPLLKQKLEAFNASVHWE